jgi:Lrp/AsnC family transcriptional regulator, leucine-responsive regulatory protein
MWVSARTRQASTDNTALEAFVRRNLFSRRHVVKVNCKMLLSRVKNRRGGSRI